MVASRLGGAHRSRAAAGALILIVMTQVSFDSVHCGPRVFPREGRRA
jgi:hypothetical protein